MRIEKMQQILNDEVEELSRLRDSLSKNGNPMSVKDKETIRGVLGNRWLRDLQTEARLFFIEGNRNDFVYVFETSLRTLEDLI